MGILPRPQNVALAHEGGPGVSQYKLFVESHRVTLVEQETGRRESFATEGSADPRIIEAFCQCMMKGISLTLEHL